jgi:hypothetical protein
LFAWAPVVRAEDRANILIYSTTSELIACHYTEHNPFSVEFNKDSAQLRVVELLSSAKVFCNLNNQQVKLLQVKFRCLQGRLSVHYTVFNVQQPFKPIQRRLLRIPALPRCHAHSPDEQIMLLGCVDASIITWDVTKDTITTIKSSFVSILSSNSIKYRLIMSCVFQHRYHFTCPGTGKVPFSRYAESEDSCSVGTEH